jgi:hypothetical protein
MKGWRAIENVILGMMLEFWGGACSWKIGKETEFGDDATARTHDAMQTNMMES